MLTYYDKVELSADMPYTSNIMIIVGVCGCRTTTRNPNNGKTAAGEKVAAYLEYIHQVGAAELVKGCTWQQHLRSVLLLILLILILLLYK